MAFRQETKSAGTSFQLQRRPIGQDRLREEFGHHVRPPAPGAPGRSGVARPVGLRLVEAAEWAFWKIDDIIERNAAGHAPGLIK